MNEKTICPAALGAFDGKDLPQMQEFLRLVQNVFDELDAQSREKGELARGLNGRFSPHPHLNELGWAKPWVSCTR